VWLLRSINHTCELATSGVETIRRCGSGPPAVLTTPRKTSSPANSDAGSSLLGRYTGAADGLSAALLGAGGGARESGMNSGRLRAPAW